MADPVQPLATSDHSRPHVYAVRDRILRSAFLIDLYAPIDSYELRSMRERMWVNGSMGRLA